MATSPLRIPAIDAIEFFTRYFDQQYIKSIMENQKFTAVLDSGKRQDFSTGSRRDTAEGKGRPDLIPTLLLERLAQHFENGAVKYGDNNWQKGQPLSRYYASAFRHLLKVKEGQEDEDHLTAAIWNLQAIMWTLEEVRAGRLPLELADLPFQLGPQVYVASGAASVVASGAAPASAAPMGLCAFCSAPASATHHRWCKNYPYPLEPRGPTEVSKKWTIVNATLPRLSISL